MSPDDAKRVLKYYMGLIGARAGIKWDSDNDAEVEDIVDYILSEPRQELEKLNAWNVQHNNSINELEKRVIKLKHADCFLDKRIVELAERYIDLEEKYTKLQQQLNNLNNKVNFPV